jgi:hypothetical protein
MFMQKEKMGMSKAAVNEAWLQQLVGDWTYAFSTADDSDHPGATASGTEIVRAVGDVWVMIENRGAAGDGSTSHSVTTLGFEPAKSRFAGSVVGTAAPVLFVYEGQVSEDGRSLVLETEGPSMTEDREIDRYRDIIRIIDKNTRETSAQVLSGEGEWREFMSSRFQRIA